MSGITGALALAACMALAGSTRADWTGVHYSYGEGEPNAIVGPREAYESTRPKTGAWTARYELCNHFADLGGDKVRVFSAHTVTFHDYVVASGHSGRSSHLALKIHLSEPVSAFRWDIGAHGRDVTPGSVLAARFGADGENWRDAYVYLAGQEALDLPPVDLRLDASMKRSVKRRDRSTIRRWVLVLPLPVPFTLMEGL